MRRAVAAALVALCASAGAGAVAAPASDRPLLGIRSSPHGGELVRLDRDTLAPVRGPRLRLGDAIHGWSFSRDGAQLVLGDHKGSLLFVDTRRLKALGKVPYPGSTPVTAWVGGRVLAVHRTMRRLWLVVVDPSRRSIVRSRSIEARLVDVGRTPQDLVLLLAPPDELGPASLAVVDAQGRVRRVTLDPVAAGWAGEEHAAAGVWKHAKPALAVDVAGRRAFVVGAGAPVAAVRLDDLRVEYHETAAPGHTAPVPTAVKKGAPDGPTRFAGWLGRGLVAVWGYDEHGSVDAAGRLDASVTAAGLHVLDTRTWTWRRIDPRATTAAAAGDVLLAGSFLWGSAPAERTSGTGVNAYRFDGSRRFQVLGQTPVWLAGTAGDRALAAHAGPAARYSVIDVRAGSVVRTGRGDRPIVLADAAASFAG